MLTLASEMGDRSQITAVALAAHYNVWLVVIGGIVGHALAMLGAILIGELLGRKVSEKSMTIFGGILFVIFSVYQLLFEVLFV